MHYDLGESGKRIKESRKEIHMTQEELAAKVGVTREFIGRIERGQVGASIDLMIEFSILFNKTLDYLILGRDNRITEQRSEVIEIIQRLQNLL